VETVKPGIIHIGGTHDKEERGNAGEVGEEEVSGRMGPYFTKSARREG